MKNWWKRLIAMFTRDKWVAPSEVKPVVKKTLTTEPAAIKPNPARKKIEIRYLFPSNFSYEELIESEYADRHEIDNTPSKEVTRNLLTLAMELEDIRAFLGYPMYISSGFRCWELNTGIGGSDTSDHPNGWCADFRCRQYGSPNKIVRALKKAGFKYDQLITEGSWVHISISPRMRGETKIAKFHNGYTTYSNFS